MTYDRKGAGGGGGGGLDEAAVQALVDAAVADLVTGAPGALDTLNELAAALGDDPNFATTLTTLVGTKANDADVVHDTGAETIAGVKTFSSDPIVPDEAYGVGWNGSMEPPTKNAVYDKVETLGAGGGAPTDAPYVTLSANGSLSAESVLGSAVLMRGILADRPAAGIAGRLYQNTDDDLGIYRDTASAWVLFGALSGWDLLGASVLGSAAASISLASLPARRHLMIIADVAGFASSDRPALQFNGDTGANYSHRGLSCAAGGTTLVNNETASATNLSLYPTGGTGNREMVAQVSNALARNKTAAITAAIAAASAAAAPNTAFGLTGTWFNAAAQITRVDLIGISGANLLADTALFVFGRD